MTDKSQPLSGAAPAPCTVFWKIMEIINRDGKALSDDAAMTIQTTLNYAMSPAAPVAVPAESRQETICKHCNNRIWIDKEFTVWRHEFNSEIRCPETAAAPAPLPPPQEPTCPDCDGTGNLYRNDVDGDFLPCATCNDGETYKEER